MADEQEAPVKTHVVRDTQTRTVNGGIIVLLIERTVRDDDGASVSVVQQDHVAFDGAAAGKLITDFHAN